MARFVKVWHKKICYNLVARNERMEVTIIVNLKKSVSLEKIVADGKLEKYLKRYLKSCRPPPDADPKKDFGTFPNLAGFCRWLGCGISEVDALRLSHPHAADWLNAVMEDEAFNGSVRVSPTLLSAYLKRRLGYSDKIEAVSDAECGEVRVIFEHDISEDGE